MDESNQQSGVQEFRSSGVQEFRSSGVSVGRAAKFQVEKRLILTEF
jgi:hypothetical protein